MSAIPRKNNFDLLRLVLAFTVCLAHLCEVSGNWTFAPLGRFFHSGIAVDCFFIVSGFLIFRSCQRSSGLASYFNKRIRRIFPAYYTVILLTAFGLPLLTGYAEQIFASKEWLHYLLANLSFLNFLQPAIPGTFLFNPMQSVNPPLWTIKVELMFYASVPFIFFLMKKMRRRLVLITIYVLSVAYSLTLLSMYQTRPLDLYLKLEKQLPGQLSFFISGGGLYLYFSLFKQYWWKLLIPGLIILFLQTTLLLQIFYPFALAVAVISFAVCLPSLGNWGKFGDISYGVYIYHFPIIQLFTGLGWFNRYPWAVFCLLIATILTTAMLSYHLIERPFLQKSSHYRLAARQGGT